MKIAPVSYLPTTAYITDPPVFDFVHTSEPRPGGCSVQPLRPVLGYRVAAGGQRPYNPATVRFWIVLQMLHPGTCSSRGTTVFYSQNGTRYREFIPYGFNGSVTGHAAWPVATNEKGCLDKTHLLNPGHD